MQNRFSIMPNMQQQWVWILLAHGKTSQVLCTCLRWCYSLTRTSQCSSVRAKRVSKGGIKAARRRNNLVWDVQRGWLAVVGIPHPRERLEVEGSEGSLAGEPPLEGGHRGGAGSVCPRARANFPEAASLPRFKSWGFLLGKLCTCSCGLLHSQ